MKTDRLRLIARVHKRLLKKAGKTPKDTQVNVPIIPSIPVTDDDIREEVAEMTRYNADAFLNNTEEL
jgi:mevalonate pyrophosphate decarboxylase